MKRKYAVVASLMILALTGCQANPAERNDTGIAQYNQGDYSAAVNDYQAAQVAAPDQPEPYYNAGSAYAQAGDLDKALAALQQALKTANDDLTAKAYFNLGNVYFQMKRFPDAVQAYEQVLLRHPDDDDARHNLELALRQIAQPSPTPDSQDATPTPDQGGGQPTATPSPGGDSVTPTPQPAGSGGSATPPSDTTMTASDAQSLLDAVQRDQQSLQQYLATPSSSDNGKDW